MKREMSQCCGIKKDTQTEKLQQIGQIEELKTKNRKHVN
jgi:hypothetical protein